MQFARPASEQERLLTVESREGEREWKWGRKLRPSLSARSNQQWGLLAQCRSKQTMQNCSQNLRTEIEKVAGNVEVNFVRFGFRKS